MSSDLFDQSNEPSTCTWKGHPDIYHALQATLASRLPVWLVMGPALAEGRLDQPASLIPVTAQPTRRRGFFSRG